MENPYKTILTSLKGQQVILTRPHASDVLGEVWRISEGGVELKTDVLNGSNVNHVFIAFEHICGVIFFKSASQSE